MQSLLCLTPRSNTPGKHDVTGAFAPEALEFARLHGGGAAHVKSFPNTAEMSVRRGVCDLAIATAKPSVLAFFCHGWRDGIQAGYRNKSCEALAALIAVTGVRELVIALYCCSTGDDGDADPTNQRTPGPGGEGGFADVLRDRCLDRGIRARVFAHATAGHTTENPFARSFGPDDAPGTGGRWLVEPGGVHWQAWKQALRDPTSTLRYRAPLMAPAEVIAELTPKVG